MRDVLQFHGDFAANELHWFRGENQWLTRTEEAQQSSSMMRSSSSFSWSGWSIEKDQIRRVEEVVGESVTSDQVDIFSLDSSKRISDDSDSNPVLERLLGNGPQFKWFPSSKTNACFNEIDRHVLSGRGDRTAFILERTNVACKHKSYRDLFVDSCRALDIMRRCVERGNINAEASRTGTATEATTKAATGAVTVDAFGSNGSANASQAGNNPLKTGDRVVFFGPNIYDHVAYIEGCKRGGLIYTCIADTLDVSSEKSALFERIKETFPRIVVLFVDLNETSSTGNKNAANTEVALRIIRRFPKDIQVLLVPNRSGTVVSDAPIDVSIAEAEDSKSLMLKSSYSGVNEKGNPRIRLSDISFLRTCPRLHAAEHFEFHSVIATTDNQDVVGTGNQDTDRTAKDQALVSKFYTELDAAPTPLDSSFPMFVIYTSGSTGKPKGLVHCHGGYTVGVLESMRHVFHVPKNSTCALKSAEDNGTKSDIILTVATPAWITGQSYMICAPLLCGITSVLMDGSPVSPSPLRFAEVIERNRVTIFKAGSTFLRQVMARYPKIGENGDVNGVSVGEKTPAILTPMETLKSFDLSSLRVGTFCAEPVSPSVHEFASSELCSNYLNSYWGSEHGGIVFTSSLTSSCCNPPKPGVVAAAVLPWLNASTLVGDCVEGSKELEVSKEPATPTSSSAGDHKSRKENTTPGELLMHLDCHPLPSLAYTIWGDVKQFEDESKRHMWRGNMLQFQRKYFPFFHQETSKIGRCTFVQGDVCVHDTQKDNFLFLGRSDDVINVGGNRFGTGEIESALLKHRKLPNSPIANLVVCGRKDEIMGSSPVAFVMLNGSNKPFSTLSKIQNELQKLVKHEVGHILAVPANFYVVKEMPETITGKYMRRLLGKIVDHVEKLSENVDTAVTQDSIDAFMSQLGDLSMLRNPGCIKEILETVIRQRNPGNAEGEAGYISNNVESNSGSNVPGSNVDFGDLKRGLQQPLAGCIRDLLENSLQKGEFGTDVPIIRLGVDSLDLARFRDNLEMEICNKFFGCMPIRFIQLFGARGLETMSADTMAEELLKSVGNNREATHRIMKLQQKLLRIDSAGCNVDKACVVTSESKVPCKMQSRSGVNSAGQKTGKQITIMNERDTRISAWHSQKNLGGLEACKRGDLAYIRKIVETDHWDPLYIRCRMRSTALMWACSGGYVQLARYLVNHVRDTHGEKKATEFVNATNKEGRCAIVYACKYAHICCLEYLIDGVGADMELIGNDGSSIFDWSVYGACVKCMNFIASRMGHHIVLRRNKFQCSVVHWAAAGGRVDVLKHLYEKYGKHGGEETYDTHDKADETPTSTIRDVDSRNASESTDTDSPVAEPKERVADQKESVPDKQEILVQKVPLLDFTEINTAGHGALTKAAWNGHKDALEWLLFAEDGPQLLYQLKAGIRDEEGLTIQELARLAGNQDIAVWLEGLVQ